MTKQEEIEKFKKRINELEAEINGYKQELSKVRSDNFEELDESERKFRLLFEKSQDPILLIEQYRFVECNQAAVNFLGFKSKEEIINIHPSKISPPYQPDGQSSDEKSKKMMDIAYQNGYHRFEWIHKSTSDEERYMDVSLIKIPYHGKQMLFTYWRDITKQKKYEQKILESEKRFVDLFEQAADGILVGVAGGIIIEANDSICKLTGYQKEELIGTNINILFDEETLTKKPLRYDLVKKGEPVIRERELIRKNGDRLFVEMSTKILGDGRMQALFRNLTRRKHAERSLIESEEKYRRIFHSSPIGIFHYDLEGVITDCNENFVEIIGSSMDALVGFNMIKSLTNKELVNKLTQSIRYGEALYEDWYESVTGNKKTYVRVLFNGIRDEQERIISGIGLVEDITARKIAENALIESEEKYRLLIEGQTDLVVKIDVDGNFLFVSPSYCEMFGKTEEELLEKRFLPLVHEDDRLHTKEEMEKLSKPPYSCYIEQRAMTRHGWRWLAWSDKAILDENNQIKEIIGVGRDISERKQTEQLIREKEEKISNIYHSSMDIIMIINQKKQIINLNEAIEQQLGYKIEDLLGTAVENIIQQNDRKRVDQRIETIFEGERLPVNEFKMISKKGKEIPFEGNTKLINYEGKSALISVVRNIQDRKELEQRVFDVMIETEERERQRLASDIHDEVGPLLSSLKMYIEMLNESSKNKDFIKSKLQNLVKETITNVREVSNALSPNVLIQYGLISALNSFFKNQKEIIDIEFNSNLTVERFGIKIETVYFRIIKELVNNTIKHAQANKIGIELKYADNQLILLYKDDGIGIEDKLRTKYKQQGLGLSNIDNRVKTINGNYSISSGKNEGFTFELSVEVNKK